MTLTGYILRLSAAFVLVASTTVAVILPAAAHSGHEVGLITEAAFGGLLQPTDLEFAPDGSVFILEKSGRLVRFDDLSDSSPTEVLDLGPNVNDYWDRGALGLAVDPGYPGRNYVYAIYSLDQGDSWGDSCPDPPGGADNGCVVDGRISRIVIDDAGLGTEEVILEGRWCAQYPSHTVGDLEFGPDGMLYASAGDGASFQFNDYGQKGIPLNPCGDPPVPVGGQQSIPTSEGGSLRAQDILTSGDPVSFDGTVIRIDPDTGLAPSTNPLIGGDSGDDPIIAYGARNPFRMTFRPGSSQLWVADVAPVGFEEVNVIANPEDGVVENFGWPCYQGDDRYGEFDILDLDLCEDFYSGALGATHTAPLMTYTRTSPPDSDGCLLGNASITGLAFYPDQGPFPEEYHDALFIGDYSLRCVWAVFPDPGGEPDISTAHRVIQNAGVVDLEMGPDGNLYAVDIDSSVVLRLRPGTSLPADFFVSDVGWVFEGNGWGPVERDRSNGELGAADGGVLAVGGVSFVKGLGAHADSSVVVSLGGSCQTFDAVVGVDDEVGVLGSVGFEVWGDGVLLGSSGVVSGADVGVPLVADVSGVDSLDLVVTNGGDGKSYDHATWGNALVTCGGDPNNQAPAATILSPDSQLLWQAGDVIPYSGSAIDLEDGVLPASALSWQIIVQHCAPTCHDHVIETVNGVSNGSFIAPEHAYPALVDIRLTAVDSGGNPDSSTVSLFPRTSLIQVRSEPPGIAMNFAEQIGPTPMDVTGIVGTTHTLTAPATTTIGSQTYSFASWSDGLPRSHEVVVPASSITLTATYVPDSSPADFFVSDVGWVFEGNGWGPVERDRSNGELGAADGGVLAVGGVSFVKGLGAHADSSVVVSLGGSCQTFDAVVGVDDEVGVLGSVGFEVWGDGVLLGSSGVVSGADVGVPLVADVSGVDSLDLVVTNGGDGKSYDHATWGNALVTCS